MRLRSDLFVSALTRRVFFHGRICRRRAARGPIRPVRFFIRLRHRNGTQDLFGPAPQMLVGEEGGRTFERRLQCAEPDTVEALMARELRFDSDLWLIELDIAEIGDLIDLVADQT